MTCLEPTGEAKVSLPKLAASQKPWFQVEIGSIYFQPPFSIWGASPQLLVSSRLQLEISILVARSDSQPLCSGVALLFIYSQFVLDPFLLVGPCAMLVINIININPACYPIEAEFLATSDCF